MANQGMKPEAQYENPRADEINGRAILLPNQLRSKLRNRKSPEGEKHEPAWTDHDLIAE